MSMPFSSTVPSGGCGVLVVLILAVAFLVGSVIAGAIGLTGAASGGRIVARVVFWLVSPCLLVLLTFGGAS
jgi:uncharacterized membrane protein YtjA (UPF0391 family)